MGKRDEERARRRKQEQRKRLYMIGGISVVAVIVLVLLILANNPATANLTAGNVTVNNTMGNANAPVKVVEYADFQCPACGTFTLTQEPKFITDYVNTGKVFFTYHTFSFIGAESVAAAQAAYCAGDQEKFWEYHNTLYKNQKGENQGNFVNANLISFAKNLGLNTDTFTSCLQGKYKQKVQDDLTEGENRGINQTPTFLVNGIVTLPTDLTKTIDAELAKVKTPAP